MVSLVACAPGVQQLLRWQLMVATKLCKQANQSGSERAVTAPSCPVGVDCTSTRSSPTAQVTQRFTNQKVLS